MTGPVINLPELRLLGFFCSQRCPPSLVLVTYDLVRALRDHGVGFVGGFQTPIEADCLTLLLRGEGQIVICPSRSAEGMRLPREWRAAADAGRLTVRSPFPVHERRKTKELGERRNAFVVSLADRLLVPYAHPDGATERAVRLALAAGKPVYTIAHPANDHLAVAGAHALPNPALIDAIGRTP